MEIIIYSSLSGFMRNITKGFILILKLGFWKWFWSLQYICDQSFAFCVHKSSLNVFNLNLFCFKVFQPY